MRIRFCLVQALVLTGLASTPSICHAEAGPLGPLVTVSQFTSQPPSVPIRILEVGQDRASFAKAHLPRAVFVDWVSDIIDPEKVDRYNIIDQVAMEALLGRLGIARHTHVVLYDNLSSRLATRMYWSMKYYGHDRVHVLDGGRSAWVSAGYRLTAEEMRVTATQYRIGKVNNEYLVDMNFIRSSLDEPTVQLLDGRPPTQFSGEEIGRVFHTGKPHKNRGHIPGAVNVFWKDNFNEDGTFRSVDALRKLYRERGLERGGTVVTYCNEGLHAAPPWFVMKELLGFDDVRVYDDSMSEWANEPLPIESDSALSRK
ncbi:MAG: sulfurtransferase [Planctomycetota bacterium]